MNQEIMASIKAEGDIDELKKIIRNAQQRIKNIKAAKPGNIAENYESKPCYGMLSFSRCSSGGIGLHGSTIPHENYITMTVKRGSIKRDFGETRYYGEDVILRVDMSQTQFSDAITSMGMGDGVPVTLDYTEIDGNIPKPPVPNTRALLENDLMEHIREARKKVADTKAKVEEITAKRTLTKKDKEELMNLLSNLEHNVSSDTVFLAEQMQRQMDKTVTEAKGEIEAFTQNRLHSIALEALSRNNALLLPENSEE